MGYRTMLAPHMVLGLAGLLGVGTAAAEISSTITATSDYDFRGFTQTDENPALQASIDWADDSGWYVGAWASNVDFGPGDPNYEVDLYTGFSGGEEDGLGWDVGIVYYAYPQESDFNYPEIYGGLSYGMFSGKLWYSNDFGNTNDSAIYLEGNAAIPLPANFTLDLHAGYSDGDGVESAYGVSNYVDYSVGVSYTLNKFDLSLRYVDTDIDNADTDDRVIFSVSTTLPW
ncbi:TorF family putative porin [Povalibacter sp.]|uniref:TorF family putative porin n=1 Tax=Povalibacter sp. TaxID=1962978 RepID=UPI002F40B3DC